MQKRDDSGEPLPKKIKTKKKSTIEEDPDNSINLFKSLRVVKARPKPESSEPKPSTSNLATNFIDESNKKSSQSLSTKSRPKATSRATRRKPKAQPDIRKVLSKQEQMFNHIVTENCLQEGLDPDELQLAMAISESLKDQHLPQSTDGPSTSSSLSTPNKFENPFTSTGKLLPISSMLERFGFKSKKNYSEYEIDMLINSKVSKRSKFHKFPTALTRMSNEKREKIIRLKIDRFLQMNESMCLVDFGDESRHDYKVFSCFLQDIQEDVKTVFAISSEDRPTEEVLLSYYVTDLFEPSFVKADHLLKDWSKIQGRDPSPERITFNESSENSEDVGVVSEVSDEVNTISSSDILDSCREYQGREIAQVDPGNDSAGSCQDIFADVVDDFELDSYDLGTDKDLQVDNSCELAGKLSLLHDKFSQSMMEADRNEREAKSGSEGTIINIQSSEELMIETVKESEHVDLTLTDTSNDEVLQFETNHEDNVEQVDLTQCEVLTEDDEQVHLTQGDELDVEDDEVCLEVDAVSRIAETSVESDVTIPFDDSYYTLQQHMKKFQSFRGLEKDTPESSLKATSTKDLEEETKRILSPPPKHQDASVQISLVSSEEETTQVYTTSKVDDGDFLESDIEEEVDQAASQDSLNDDECIEISDEEVNYSMRKFQNYNDDPSDMSSETGNSNHEENLTQGVLEADLVEPFPIEVNNIVEESLVDVMIVENDNSIDDTISSLLQKSTIVYTPMASTKERSMRANESLGLSDSIKDIMKRYGLTTEAKKETPRSFKKMQSDSLLHKTVRFSIEDEDDIVDLTQQILEDDSMKENSFRNNNFDTSIHQSLENITNLSPVVPQKQISRPTAKKRSLGVQVDDDYIVDTDTLIPEADFKNMTPVELKKELSKYGIRSLPVKKAIALLEHIYNQIYPEIRVAADEEIDMNDTRRIMNITDIVTNIEMQDDDFFVFQPGLVEDEEVVLPKAKKSKVRRGFSHNFSISNNVSSFRLTVVQFHCTFRSTTWFVQTRRFRSSFSSFDLLNSITFTSISGSLG